MSNQPRYDVEHRPGQQQRAAYLQSVFPNGRGFSATISIPHVRQAMIFFISFFLTPLLQQLKLELPSEFMTEDELRKYLKHISSEFAKLSAKNKLASSFPPEMKSWFHGKCDFKNCEAILEASKRFAIPDLQDLKQASTGTEMYGETSSSQMRDIIKKCNMDEKKAFLDIGSGFGQLPCMVAALTNVEVAYGVEVNGKTHQYAMCHRAYFECLMAYFGQKCRKIVLRHGDATKGINAKLVQTKSSVILANNLQFDAQLSEKLIEMFKDLDDGTQIITTDRLCSKRATRSRHHFKTQTSLTHMSLTETLEHCDRNTDWSSKSIPYYLTTIDRSVTYEESLKHFNADEQNVASRKRSWNTSNSKIDQTADVAAKKKKADDDSSNLLRIQKKKDVKSGIPKVASRPDNTKRTQKKQNKTARNVRSPTTRPPAAPVATPVAVKTVIVPRRRAAPVAIPPQAIVAPVAVVLPVAASVPPKKKNAPQNNTRGRPTKNATNVPAPAGAVAPTNSIPRAVVAPQQNPAPSYAPTMADRIKLRKRTLAHAPY